MVAWRTIVLGLLVAGFSFAGAASDSGTGWSTIDSCPASPFCIDTGSYDQPFSDSSRFAPGEGFNYTWMVNASGSRGVYDVRVFANSTNSNVGESVSGSEEVEIQFKGLIPNSETTGFPFYIQSGTSNPGSTSESFTSDDTLRFSAMVNASGAFGNYSTFFIANSTNPNVGEQESGRETVEIVEEPTDPDPPELRNFNANSSSFLRNQSLGLSVEARDGETGVYKAVLSTNETGQFENKSGVYGSPNFFNNVTGMWVTANFTWSNESFTGLLGTRVWVRDAYGNWNSTDTKVFNVSNLEISEVADQSIGINESSSEGQGLDEDNSVSVGVSDDKDSSSIYSRVKGQAVGFIDRVGAGFNVSRLFGQEVSIDENVFGARVFPTNVVQPVGVSESADVTSFNSFTGISQPVTVADFVSVGFNARQGFDENVNITSDRARAAYVQRQPTEFIGITDEMYEAQVLLQSPTEDVGFDDRVSVGSDLVRGFTQDITVLSSPAASINYNAFAGEDVGVSTAVDSTVSWGRNVFQNILIGLDLSSNSKPRVVNATVNVDSLGGSNDVSLDLYVRDVDGISDIESITYNGMSVSSIEDETVRIDLTDDLVQNRSVVVSDGKASTEFSVGFNITDNLYMQNSSYSANLSSQKAFKNDSFSNIGENNLAFNISVDDKDGQFIEGGNLYTSLGPGNSTALYSELQGDFLEEERQWHTDPDVRQTVYNQTIEQTVNISNEISDIDWTGINATGTTVPQAFQPCSDCGSKIIDVPGEGYSNTGLWRDTGDGLNDRFVQDITDVVIGERNRYWEEYRYNNVTEEVRFNDIWLNESIDDNTTYVTPFVQVKDGGEWNTTEIVPETRSCNSISPDTDNFTVNDVSFEVCSKDIAGSNKPEYFQLQIGSLNKVYDIRFGLGEKVFLPEAVEAGQLCEDGLEGETFNDGELTCYRNEIRYSDQIELPERNVAQQIGTAIAGFIIFILLVLSVLAVFYREELEETLEGQFPTPFNNSGRR